MKRNVLVTISLFSIIFILSQCSEYKKNLVGSDFFVRNNWGFEKYSVFYPSPSDTFFQKFVNTGDAVSLFVGSDGHSFNQTFLKFLPVIPNDGIPDSAKITLYYVRTHTKVTDSFVANVYEIEQDWTETDFTSEYFNDAFIGNRISSFTINTLDDSTEIDSVKFSIPVSLIETWSDTTLEALNHGIVINSLTSTFIAEFYSKDDASSYFHPILTLYTTEDTTQATYYFLPSEDTYISTLLLEPDPEELIIAHGIAFRSLLYFNLDSIPKTATINNASLILFSDTLRSFPYHSDGFEFYAYSVTDSIWTAPDIAYDSTSTIVGVTIEDSAYIDITTYVQDWTAGFNDNCGLLLKGTFESSSIYSKSFYSSRADSSLMPKLKIYYSLPPSGGQ